MDRIPSNLETELRTEFTNMFEHNKVIEQVFRRVKIGTATYEDGELFANAIGEILSKVLKGIVTIENVDLEDLAYNVLGNALNQNYRLTALVSETIQTTLNEMAGVGVSAVVPTINSNRIYGLQELILNAEDKSQIMNILGEPIVNFTQSCVDDFVEQNASFQKNAGLEPIIIRKYEGMHFDPHRKPHMQDCPYCKRLAGEWAYGEQPTDVYKRHEGCRCTVEYYPNKKAKGQIIALRKGEKDTGKVLWNTGKVFSNTRKSVLQRRRREFGKDESRRILNEEWKGGFKGNAERHFT